MTVKRVFNRPPPLPAEGNYEFTKGKWYELVEGKDVSTNFVSREESIYFMWFEYLKRSKKYETACQNNGVGMEQLFADFGNVYECEFVDWWAERGSDLFAEREIERNVGFLDMDEVLDRKSAIESGELKLIAIPTNLKKTEIRSKLADLVKELEVNPDSQSTALYPLTNSRIDPQSLAKCLLAYDLKQEGKTNLFIGGYIQFVDESLGEECLIEKLEVDARKNHVYVDNEELREKFLEKDEELEKKIAEAMVKVDKRLVREGRRKSTEGETKDVDLDEWNELLEKELGLLVRKTGLEIENPKLKKMVNRSQWKRYLNTSASRMIKKAEANITAVEQGKFPVGHN